MIRFRASNSVFRLVCNSALRNFLTYTKHTLSVFGICKAGMAELADALDLGSSAVRRGGSSPSTRTKQRT